jgi:hypothetical protein
MSRGAPWLLVSLVLAALAPATANAEPTAAEIAVARQLFSDAAALEEAGDHAGAASKLREALAIKETPGLRFHLAHAEEAQGHLVEAMVEYDRADELMRLGAQAPDVAELMAPARAALRERTPTLMVRLPANVTDVRLTIDGTAVATTLAGKPVPLNPGSHQVAVSAPGRKDFRLELLLVEGEDRVVEAELIEATEPRAAPPPASELRKPAAADTPDAGDFGAREIVLIAEGALALAGAAIGVIYILNKESEDDRAARDRVVIDSGRLDDTTGCAPTSTTMLTEEQEAACNDLPAAIAASHRAKDTARAGFIVGGAGLVALIGTWILWPVDSNDSASAGLTPVAGGAVSTLRFRF